MSCYPSVAFTGPAIYEREIEALLWDNLEDLTGETLFRIARQPHVRGGGIPDVVALDHAGRVVVIEVKRDVDRSQLAQCLEYAGWARSTNLDELSGLYHDGPDEFFRGWLDFTGSTALQVVNPSPRLFLVARTFHGRTESALSYLIEHGLPVQLLPVVVYEDHQGRRLVDVQDEREPVLSAVVAGGSDARLGATDHTMVGGRRVRLLDLLEAGLVEVDEKLHWDRPRVGGSYDAVVTANGGIRLDDGREFSSPSRTAMAVAGVASYDGWYAWRVERLGGVTLNDLRLKLAQARASTSESDPDATP